MKAIFFPKSEIPTKVCAHRYGAKMTYTEQTDSLFNSSRYAVEYYAHKYGYRVGAFINRLTQSGHTDLLESEKYGACKFDIYFTTDYWYNPITGNIEVIPDYYKTSWTQTGINTFGYVEGGVTKINGVAVSVGDAKTSSTPNIGTQMYAYSNGKYGWNNTGVFGQSAAKEIVLLQKNVTDWFRGIFGRFPSSMSYRNGNTGGAYIDVVFYLQCRNSGTGAWNNTANAPTWYGKNSDNNYLGVPQQDVDRNLLASRASTTRWWDWIDNIYNITLQQSLDAVKSIVTQTIGNGGWQNNFTHWHSAAETTKENIKLGSYNAYFGAISEAAGNNRIHFCNYGEASEYLLYRSCIDNIAAYKKGNRVAVAVSIKDVFADAVLQETGVDAKLPQRRIFTPVSIEVDLTGTPLQGKNVKSNYGKVINAGNNKVIVEIPFPAENDGIMEVELYNNIFPDWLNIDKPTISNVVVNGQNVTFTTDIPCYCTIFEKTDANTISKFGDRLISEYKTNHVVKIGNASGNTYSIGVCTETGQTALYDL